MPVPSQDKLKDLRAGRASGVKMGDDGGGSLISLDGVVPSRIISVSASDYYYLLNTHSVQHTETDNEDIKTHKTIK